MEKPREQYPVESDGAVVELPESLLRALQELTSPLTTLKLGVGALRRDERGLEPLPPAQRRELAARVECAVTRMSTLVQALLELAGAYQRKDLLRTEEIELGALARGVAAAFTQALPHAAKVRVAATKPVIGAWHRGRVEQVLQNLIGSALQHSSFKPVLVSIWSEAGFAYCSVREGGAGLSLVRDQRQPRPSVADPGSALGLWFVQRLVASLGGELEVARGERGGEVTVILPCEAAIA
jgi:signal transduction histidine kinase